MLKRTPAHVGRINPQVEKRCFSELPDLEYIRGLITEMSRSDFARAGEGVLILSPPGGIDTGLIHELWEIVGRENTHCNLLKVRGVTIGQRYEDFLGSLSNKYGEGYPVPITHSELDELDRLQHEYLDAALDDMLQIDTGEGYEQPPPPPPPQPPPPPPPLPRPSLLPPALR